MYQQAGLATAAGTTGGLASTGVGVLWIVMAAFAILAAGTALTRIVPKMHKHTAH